MQIISVNKLLIESELGALLGSDFLSRIHNIDSTAPVVHAVYRIC